MPLHRGYPTTIGRQVPIGEAQQGEPGYQIIPEAPQPTTPVRPPINVRGGARHQLYAIESVYKMASYQVADTQTAPAANTIICAIVPGLNGHVLFDVEIHVSVPVGGAAADVANMGLWKGTIAGGANTDPATPTYAGEVRGDSELLTKLPNSIGAGDVMLRYKIVLTQRDYLMIVAIAGATGGSQYAASITLTPNFEQVIQRR